MSGFKFNQKSQVLVEFVQATQVRDRFVFKTVYSYNSSPPPTVRHVKESVVADSRIQFRVDRVLGFNSDFNDYIDQLDDFILSNGCKVTVVQMDDMIPQGAFMQYPAPQMYPVQPNLQNAFMNMSLFGSQHYGPYQPPQYTVAPSQVGVSQAPQYGVDQTMQFGNNQFTGENTLTPQESNHFTQRQSVYSKSKTERPSLYGSLPPLYCPEPPTTSKSNVRKSSGMAAKPVEIDVRRCEEELWQKLADPAVNPLVRSKATSVSSSIKSPSVKSVRNAAVTPQSPQASASVSHRKSESAKHIRELLNAKPTPDADFDAEASYNESSDENSGSAPPSNKPVANFTFAERRNKKPILTSSQIHCPLPPRQYNSERNILPSIVETQEHLPGSGTLDAKEEDDSKVKLVEHPEDVGNDIVVESVAEDESNETSHVHEPTHSSLCPDDVGELSVHFNTLASQNGVVGPNVVGGAEILKALTNFGEVQKEETLPVIEPTESSLWTEESYETSMEITKTEVNNNIEEPKQIKVDGRGLAKVVEEEVKEDVVVQASVELPAEETKEDVIVRKSVEVPEEEIIEDVVAHASVNVPEEEIKEVTPVVEELDLEDPKSFIIHEGDQSFVSAEAVDVLAELEETQPELFKQHFTKILNHTAEIHKTANAKKEQRSYLPIDTTINRTVPAPIRNSPTAQNLAKPLVPITVKFILKNNPEETEVKVVNVIAKMKLGYVLDVVGQINRPFMFHYKIVEALAVMNSMRNVIDLTTYRINPKWSYEVIVQKVDSPQKIL